MPRGRPKSKSTRTRPVTLLYSTDEIARVDELSRGYPRATWIRLASLGLIRVPMEAK